MIEEKHIIAKKWLILDATTIKLIAMILMVLDHIHQMYASAGAPLWLTMLGRPVFPLFLFLAADSFYYTKSRKSYLKRLLYASWGMTVMTAFISKVFPNPNIVLMNNAFSTFFVTGLYIQFWDWFVKGIAERKTSLILKSLLGCIIPILCTAPLFVAAALSFNENVPAILIRILAFIALLIPSILTVEGGFLLIILGVLFYIFRRKRILQVLILLIFSLMVYILDQNSVQWLMCGAAIPMLLYNGERGRGLKQLFYIFYPAHIILLYLCATIFS